MSRLHLYICCLGLVCACQRQSLVDEEPQCSSATISLEIDWSLSQMDPDDIENVSIYAYPESGGLPYTKITYNIESTSVELPIGSYSLLIMSDAVGDVVGVNFRNSSYYDLFSAESIEDSDPSGIYYDPAEDEMLRLSSGQIAVWRMDHFEVTEEMAWCQYCEVADADADVTLEVQPTPVTAICQIEVRFENLDNAQSVEAALRGLSDGVTLSTNSPIAESGVTNVYVVDMVQWEYDDSSDMTSGVVLAEIFTFGKQSSEGATYSLALDIILNSGEMVSYTRDVTSQVSISEDFNIFINLTSDDDQITLPDSSGTGFGVEEWGDNELVELL